MHNAIPNSRSALESTGGFASSNDLFDDDHDDEFTPRGHKFDQEELDLGERRKYSTISGKSDMSSVEVPARDPTVDAGNEQDFPRIFLPLK